MDDTKKRIDFLEKEARHFHRQNEMLIKQLAMDGVLIQQQGKEIKALKRRLEDDFK